MIRAPRHFNGTFISRHFFPSFFKHNSLRVINSGRCYDWAYFAHRLFGVTLWTTDYHAWVQVFVPNSGYRFFDSETPKGVRNFMELGCNRRHAPQPWEDQPPAQMRVDKFKDFWDQHGGGHRRHWDSMLESQLREVLGKRFSEMTPIFAKASSVNNGYP